MPWGGGTPAKLLGWVDHYTLLNRLQRQRRRAADTWGVSLPEGYFDNAVGPEPFRETISRFGGPGAQEEWDRLTEYLLELSECTMGLPPFSLRTGGCYACG